jgi:hypothetical protein
VVFSSIQPTTKIVVAGNLATAAAGGLVVLLGLVLFVAGIVVAVVGIRRKDRQSRWAYPRTNTIPSAVQDHNLADDPQGAGR